MSIPQKIRAKINRESKYLRRDIDHALGLDKNFYKNARGSRILIYHGICRHDHTRFNPIFLTAGTFEKHLQLYKRYCNVLTLDDFYNGRFSNEKFNVCITFDDGFVNNYKYVLPLLKIYNMPATFFITAIRDAGYDILWNDFMGMLGKHGPERLEYKGEWFYKGKFNKYIAEKSGVNLTELLRLGDFDVKAEALKLLYQFAPYRDSRPADRDYWLQMTPDEIKELASSPLATIGSHGYYHNDLAHIGTNKAADEMVRSKKYLEEITGKSINSLAFPYGSYTRHIVGAAKDAGYNQLLSMDFHFGEDYADTTMRERFTVNPFISPINQLHATITRQYEL